MPGLRGGTQAEGLEGLAGRVLGSGIAHQVDALFGKPDAARCGSVLHPAAPVIEKQVGLEVLVAPGFAFLRDLQAEARWRPALLELYGLIQVKGRHRGAIEQACQNAIAIGIRKRDLAQSFELREPWERAVIQQRRDQAARENEPALHGQLRLGQRHARARRMHLVRLHLEPQSPGLARVPRDRFRFHHDTACLQRKTPRPGQDRYQPGRERAGKNFAAGHGVVLVSVIFLASQNQSQRVHVDGVRQGGDLRRRDSELLERRPLPVLLSGAREELQHDGGGCLRGGRIDDVHQVEIARPFGHARVLLVQHAADFGQVSLPGGRGRRGGRTLGLDARLPITGIIIGLTHKRQVPGVGGRRKGAAPVRL